MASFPSGLVLQCACRNYQGIYLGLIKENLLHDCAAIVPGKLSMRDPAKQFFANRGGGSQSVAHSVVYIYINCPLKNVI